MRQVLFMNPPVWMYTAFFLLGAGSFAFIFLGVVLLIRHTSDLSAQGRIIFAAIPLGLVALSPLLGYASTFPFGLFFGMVVLAFAGWSGQSWLMIVLGCLLNTLGIFGVLSLFRRRIGLP